MAPAERLCVSVAYSPRAAEVDEVIVALAPGATLADAIAASGLAARHPDIDWATARLGIWGRVQPATTLLRDRDRVEVYRALQVDPKEARRLRFRKSTRAPR